MPDKKIITYTGISTFMECPTKYKWRYIEKLQRVGPPGAKEFGTAIHAALEVLFKTGDIHEAETALNGFSPLAGPYGLSEEDFARARGLLAGYYGRWGSPKHDYETIKVEKTFSFKVPNSEYSLEGKIDLLLRDRKTGKLQLWDHKTCSQLDEDYITQRWMDLQLHIYTIGALEGLGYNVDELVYDILQKPAVRLKKNETIEEFTIRCGLDSTPDKFERPVFAVDPRVLDDTRNEVAGWLAKVELANVTGFFGKNYKACKVWSRCPYWDLCVSGGNKMVRDNGYVVVKENPELETLEKAE